MDRLDDHGQLQLEVRTADLGTDNKASVHLYDAKGHIEDLPLTWKQQTDGEDVFTGSVAIEALKQRGFDVTSLQQQPFVSYAADTQVLWGDSQSYDAKHYRQAVDDRVWRGSSINDAGDLAELLQNQHPRLIISLRETKEDKFNRDEALVRDANRGKADAEQVKVVRIPVQDFHPPTLDQVKQFLALVTAPENQPAYVHCRAGIGRTGTMIAAYRMAVGHFTAQQAIDEAKTFGLSDPAQIAFLRDFSAKLQAGEIPGFPR